MIGNQVKQHPQQYQQHRLVQHMNTRKMKIQSLMMTMMIMKVRQQQQQQQQNYHHES